tara:strand:- start:169 stop:1176 length:1008 start_codon:yes stop_codon:yes gene_type:complete
MPRRRRTGTVQLVSSDATDEDENCDHKRPKIAHVKTKAHEDPMASTSEVDEVLGGDDDADLAALVQAEWDNLEKEGGVDNPEMEDGVPEVLDASDDEDRPLVHPKKLWLSEVLGEIKKSKTLSKDSKEAARKAFARYMGESDAESVYNAFVACSGEAWVPILDNVRPPPGGWQPLLAAAAEVANESDEKQEAAPLCTHVRVQKILESWTGYKAMLNFKNERGAVREVKGTDKNLRRLKGRCAYEKLFSWVSAATRPHDPTQSIEEYAKMLYLMLATKTTLYKNVTGLVQYLKRTPPEEAMAHICLNVLNKSVDDGRVVPRVAAFHSAVAKLVAGQ